MRFETSSPLPGVLRWTPQPEPLAAAEAWFAHAWRADDSQTSTVLLEEGDFETFREEAETLRESAVTEAIASGAAGDAEAFWQRQRRARLAFEAYTQRTHYEAARALMVEATEDEDPSLRAEERLEQLFALHRRVVATRQHAQLEGALARCTSEAIDTAVAKSERASSEVAAMLREATGGSSTTRVIALEFEGPSWQIPAKLGFGGFNHCPRVADHVTILRAWASRYGARVVAMGLDGLGLAVSRPPRDAAGLCELAMAHWLYCGDPSPDAERLLTVAAAPVWRFRW